jgi:hypothetical protein
MALGIATFKMIKSLLNDAYGYAISEDALLRRLSILRRGGYIGTRKETYVGRHGRFTVYALTKTAARVLAEMSHYPIEQVRIGLPKPYFVRHELWVTNVLHEIEREIYKGHYKYSFVDSSVLKQCREKKSKAPIPDLKINLYRKSGDALTLFVEVDLGTVLTRKMVGRIQAHAKPGGRIVTVLCKKPRLHNLRCACDKSYFSGKGSVIFGELNEFCKNGFVDTTFMIFNGEPAHLNINNE